MSDKQERFSNKKREFFIPNLDKWLSVVQLAIHSGMTRQAINLRISVGDRGNTLIRGRSDTQSKGSKLVWRTPSDGWTGWALHWLRKGLSPRGNYYDYKPAPTWVDDDHELMLDSMQRQQAMGATFTGFAERSDNDEI